MPKKPKAVKTHNTLSIVDKLGVCNCDIQTLDKIDIDPKCIVHGEFQPIYMIYNPASKEYYKTSGWFHWTKFFRSAKKYWSKKQIRAAFNIGHGLAEHPKDKLIIITCNIIPILENTAEEILEQLNEK